MQFVGESSVASNWLRVWLNFLAQIWKLEALISIIQKQKYGNVS